MQFTSCGDPTYLTQYLSQEQKDWCNYKKGSYWIYQEEGTGTTDSFYCYKDTTFIEELIEEYSESYHETTERFVASTNPNDSFFYIVGASSYMHLFKIGKSPDSEIDLECLLVPFVVSSTNDPSLSPHSIRRITLDTPVYNYELKGIKYDETIKMTDNFNTAFNATETIIYTAKGVGIIRKEFPEYGQVWNLVRYHIEQ
ncbi:MAG: hypothetical protein H6607_12230 [Flavobacteriales bacterium]|nr:hypothetical protein [Flavobacteriales bacterium]